MEISKQELQDILISIDSEDIIKIDHVDVEEKPLSGKMVFEFKNLTITSYNKNIHLIATLDNIFASPKRCKPPLGLRPSYIWNASIGEGTVPSIEQLKERLDEIQQAFLRYIDAFKPIPREWINEYSQLLERYSGKDVRT